MANNILNLNKVLALNSEFFNSNSFDNVFNLEKINIISSLSIVENGKYNSKNNNKELVASIKLHLGELNIMDLMNNLKTENLDLDEIHLILVSWDHAKLDKIITEEYSNVDVRNHRFKLVLTVMSYRVFFNDLNNIKDYKSDYEKKNKDYLDMNPIIIFQGLHWGNIVYLFELNGLTIHGGSISRRQKLSITQFRLAKFLHISHLAYSEKQKFYNSYIDKVFTSPKYDVNYYNHLLNLGDYKSFPHINPIVLEYLKVNNSINLNTKLSDIMKKKDRDEKELNLLEGGVNLIEKELEEIEFDIKYKRSKLSDLDNINRSIKHKASITGNLNKLNNGKKKLEIERDKFNNEISRLKSNILNYSKSISSLTELEDKLDTVTSHLNSKSNSFVNNRGYLNFSRNYSTICLVNRSFNPINSNLIEKSRASTFFLFNNLKGKDRHFLSLHSNGLKSRAFSSDNDKEFYSFIEGNAATKNNEPVFNYLDMIDEIIKKSNGDLFISQKQIETEWINFMTMKLSDMKSKLRNSMATILIKAMETLELRIKNNNLKKRFPKLYDKFNKDHLIITFSYILTYRDIYGFTSLAQRVGVNILFNIFRSELKKGANVELSEFEEFKNKVGFIDNIDQLKLGAFFLEIFCRPPTEVFFRSYKNYLEDDEDDDYEYDGNVKSVAVLEINREYMETVKNNLIIHPTSLPMICPPNKWSDELYGGFLNNRFEKRDLITGSPHHDHKIEKKDKLYNAINYLNTLKFEVNNKLLDYLENEGKFLLDTYIKGLKSDSKKLQFYISLKVAKIFSKFPFYISTGADWRGRIYTKSFFLSYQADDFSSALLNFYYGEPLTATGKKYLYIFGANCYNINNLSKKSYDERVQWVKNNYDKIIKMEPSFILKADSKFLFVAFCLCLKELHSDSNTIIKLPVYLDATCSGIQHLAALLRDFETGSKVNLIPQKESEMVGDIYSYLINPINEAIRKFAHQNSSFKVLKDIKLERDYVKSPVMTKTYNVSVRGIAQQLKSKMLIKKISKNENHYYAPGINGPILITYLDIFKIAEIIDEQIFTSFPSLKNIYEYFKEIIKFMSKFNIPMTWFTPSGMQITQHYNISKQNKISIKFGKGSKTIVLREKTPKLNKNKQIQGIIPNIIHSLDASHLINLINTATSNNLSPVITNHDCFATHPNKLEELYFLVKKEFILLYTNSGYLNIFEKRIIQSIKDNNFEIFTEKDGRLYIKPYRTKKYIPIIPKLGKLDIDQILESKYMIT